MKIRTCSVALSCLVALSGLRLDASSASVSDGVLTIALTQAEKFSDVASEHVGDLTGNTITNVTVTGAYRLTADTSIDGYTGTWTIADGSLYATVAKSLGTGKITMASRGCLEFGVNNGTFANEIAFTDPNFGNQKTSADVSGINLCFAAATTLSGNISAASNLCVRTSNVNATISGDFSAPNGTVKNQGGHEGCTLYFSGKVTVKKLTGTTANGATSWWRLSNPANNICWAEAYYGQLNFTGKNCSTNSIWQQGYSGDDTNCRGRIQLTADQTIDRLTWPSTSVVPDAYSVQTRHQINFQNGSTLTMRATATDHSDVRLTGTGNFLWAPVDKTFTNTFERSRTQDLQGWWGVSNGVLKVIGTPTFPKLTGIYVFEDGTLDFDLTAGDDVFTSVTTLSVGKNGRADFKDFQPFAKMADLVIRMDSAGFLTMKPGTYAPLKFFLNGVQTGGLFTGLNGTAEGATKVAWLDDDVVINAPEVEIESVPRTWDAGGGDDTRVSNPLNWNGDTLPDLTAGSLLATFAAGTKATFDTSVNFKGLVFTTSAFTFEPVGGGGTFKVGEEGIAVNGGTFSNDVAMTIARNQTWTAASGKKMTLTAPIKNDGTSKRTVTFNGPGDLVLVGCGAASDYQGTFNVYAGTVTLTGEEPFGVPAADGSTRVNMQSLNGATKVHFNGMRMSKALVFEGDNADKRWDVAAWVTNEFAGPVTFTGTHRPYWNGGILLFSGGMKVAGTIVPDYSHTMIYRNKPCYFDGQWQDGSGEVFYECSSNYIWASSYYVSGRKHWLKAPYALCWDNGDGTCKYSTFEMTDRMDGGTLVGRGGAGVFELWGYPQTIGNWYMGPRVNDLASTYFINSKATPSDLHMVQSRLVDKKYAENLWLNDFKGRINLYKEGLSPAVISNVAVSAVGEIHVIEGELRFAAGGSWRGATNVTVAAGAKLGVAEAGTFGPYTVIDLPNETGAFTLGSAVPPSVRFLKVGGVPLAPALYCAPGAGVPGATEHAVFAGTGAIRVRGVQGFAIMTR